MSYIINVFLKKKALHIHVHEFDRVKDFGS